MNNIEKLQWLKDVIEKSEKVIFSCKTLKQADSCRKYLNNFNNVIEDKFCSFSQIENYSIARKEIIKLDNKLILKENSLLDEKFIDSTPLF